MPHGNAPNVHDDEVDHCVCDIELAEDEATADAELPPAAGGIELVHGEPVDEQHVDGCDADFNATEPTLDEELPVTVGGM